MKKFSNKGFVLAETIIVAVFMVTIFSALYTNYFPLMANYEKREYYDDLDSKYIAFWLKYMIQDPAYEMDNCTSSDGTHLSGPGCIGNGYNYTFFDCNRITDSTKNKSCRRLIIESGLASNPYCRTGLTGELSNCKDNPTYFSPLKPNPGSMPLQYVAIITPYNLTEFKKNLDSSTNPLYNGISDGMIDYINSLPDYIHASNNQAKYRIILELYDNRESGRVPMYKYSTIEVTKK